MKRLYLAILLLTLTLSPAQAGFFSDLFEIADESKEKQFQDIRDNE